MINPTARLAAATTRERGAWAEELACRYLCGKGMKVLSRNYRCKYGEIDLVMEDNTTTVFVEVRYRRDAGFGTGADSVDSRKRQRLVATANHYLLHHPRLRANPARFDVVSVSREGGQAMHWIPAAFEA